MMKYVWAAGLVLVSNAAAAVPVSATGGVTNWDLFWYAQTDSSPSEYGHDYVFGEFAGSATSIEFVQNVGIDGARSSASSGASYATSLIENDDFFSFTLSVNLAVNLSVDPSLSEGRAHAYARTRGTYLGFEVFDSVLYQGPHILSGAGGDFAGGSILTPGFYRYQNASPGADRLTATVLGGESIALSRTYDYEYVFAKVPVPASLPLLAGGLLSLIWVRRRRRAKYRA